MRLWFVDLLGVGLGCLELIKKSGCAFYIAVYDYFTTECVKQEYV